MAIFQSDLFQYTIFVNRNEQKVFQNNLFAGNIFQVNTYTAPSPPEITTPIPFQSNIFQANVFRLKRRSRVFQGTIFESKIFQVDVPLRRLVMVISDIVNMQEIQPNIKYGYSRTLDLDTIAIAFSSYKVLGRVKDLTELSAIDEVLSRMKNSYITQTHDQIISESVKIGRAHV